MSQKITQVLNKKLLINTNEDEKIYGVHHIRIDHIKSLDFKISELTPLQFAEKTLDKEVFLELCRTCLNIKKNDLIPELTNYKNAENLQVYMKETETFYLVVSFGEYQPTLYRIYLEAVFEKV